MKNIKIIATLFVLSLGLSACGNTLQGLGQDIEHAGESIQKATK